MMGIIPATGTEISMECVYTAFGLTPIPGSNIGLNSTLGVNRQPPQASGTTGQQTAIPASTETELSLDMGGLTTADDYCCTLTFWCENVDTVLDGWNTPELACNASGVLAVTAYFSGFCPQSWQSAIANGTVIYLNSDFTNPFTTAIGYYKSTATLGQGISFAINGSGIPTSSTSC